MASLSLRHQMVGWRGRIGIIYPEDGLLDSDFHRCAPSGVSVHITRSFRDAASDQLDVKLAAAMAERDDIEASARSFLQIDPDCVAYACTAASFSRGVGFDQELIRRL
jgi:maleate isomerase